MGDRDDESEGDARRHELPITTTERYDKDDDLETWLGGRDLNPDNVVQRAVKVFQ
jgi:hypothetical protein